MDSETAERLRSILGKKKELARQDQYHAQGTASEQKIKGEISAYKWCMSLLSELEEGHTKDILDDLETRLDQKL